MKIRQLSFVLLLFMGVLSGNLNAQTNSLYISSMPAFPDLPQDSAYEGISYTFDLIIINNTSTTFNSVLSFNMRVDTSVTTFLTNPQTTMLPGDTLNLTVPLFDFTQPQFKVGNNIVVVWPGVNGVAIPIDSFITNVFFVPLNSLPGNYLKEETFKIYPVPARNILHINSPNLNTVEYVRIINLSGQPVCLFPTPGNGPIDISFLKPGIYFVEIISEFQSTRMKFVKE